MAENNPYDSQSSSGYRAVDPPDDGSRTAANALTWSRHTTQLSEPLHNFSISINAETLSAFGELAMTTDPGEETVVVAMQEFGRR